MTLDHDKRLQVYFFCVKRQAKNAFLKDVKSTVVRVYKVVKLCNMSKDISPTERQGQANSLTEQVQRLYKYRNNEMHHIHGKKT